MARNNLRQILYGFTRVEEVNRINSAIETWENQVRDYEKKHNKEIDDDLKVAALLELVPEKVKDHVTLNARRG